MTLVGSAVVPQATPMVVVKSSTKMMDLAIVSRLRVAFIDSSRSSGLDRSKPIETSRVESIVSIVPKTLRGWPVNCSRDRILKILSRGDMRIALSIIF